MSEEIIRNIAEEVVNRNILNNIQFYLIIVALTFVASSAGSFIISYFKKRGEQYATKSDMESILDELDKTTRLSHEIKNEIDAKFQDEQGLKVLIREKLENIMSETFELELWLEKARSKAISRISPDMNESPISKIEMFQAIYFQEVEAELDNLKRAYFPLAKQILSLATGAPLDVNEFDNIQRPFLNCLTALRKSLIEKYAPKVGL